MNEVEALTTVLSNSPLAGAVVYLALKVKGAFDRFISAIEGSASTAKEGHKAQLENNAALEKNTIAIEQATLAATQGGTNESP